MSLYTKSCLPILLACSVQSGWSMDLTQAYQSALERDASTNAARATAAAGQEYIPQAKAQLMPNVSANFSRTRNELTTINPNILGQLADSSTNYPSSSNALVVRQPVYRPYQWANFRQAQAQVDDVNAILDYTLQNLAVSVASAYFEALLAADQLALTRKQLTTFRTQLDAARKMLEAGSGTRTDIDEVQARLDLSLAQEMEAKQNVDYTLRQLQVLVNQPFEQMAVLDPAKMLLLPPMPENIEGWVERAEQSSPEMRVLRARLEHASLEVDKASSGHYPTLDAVAQWSSNSSESQQNIDTTYQNRSFGLQLNIPIFSGGGVNSAVRQALANKEKALQSLEAGRRDLGVRVFKEFRGVTEGVLKVKALEQAVRSADQALQSSQKSFQAGVRTRLDILNAENTKMIAMRDLAQARYLYLLSTLRLKALVGDIEMASVEAINSYFVQ